MVGGSRSKKSFADMVPPEDKSQVMKWEKSVDKLTDIVNKLEKNHLRVVRDEKPKSEITGKVIYPVRCTAELPEDLEQPHLIGEEKLDGSRYVLYLGPGMDPYGRQKSNTLLSRHHSRAEGEGQGKLVDRTYELAHVTKQDYPALHGTIIDGETMNGYETYNAFDIMFFCGTDVRPLPLSERRKILEKVIKLMNNKSVTVIPQVTKNLREYFLSIVEAGREGIVVKDITRPYGHDKAWAKMKKSFDVSVVVTGQKEGKEADTVGSVFVSVFEKGKLIEIGCAAGFTQKDKIAMAKNFKKYMGRVVDVFAQELTNKGTGRLRHCTFHKWRDELDPKDCTFEKLKADLKKGVRKNRTK
jgi:ATP-dependent DNA ligase